VLTRYPDRAEAHFSDAARILVVPKIHFALQGTLSYF
jgi:hypothetical protein